MVRTSADSITVRFGSGRDSSLALSSDAVRNAAAGLGRRREALIAAGDAGPHALVAIGVRANATGRLTAMLAVAVMLLALAALLGTGPVRQLTLGIDGLHSGSTWQMLVWFTTVVVAYGATLLLRTWAGGIAYTGGVSIPPRLLALAGISGLTFAGARAIRNVQERREAARKPAEVGAARIASAYARVAPPAERKSEEPAPPRARFPADLVHDRSARPDLGNIQLVVVTLIAVSVYLVRVFAWLGQVELACETSLPDLDAALVGMAGVAHATYLAKKAASPLGHG